MGAEFDRESAFADAAAAEAEQVEGGLRQARPVRPGRPKGSTNKKTAEFEAYYQEQGYRDPLIAMADFVSADLVQLQAWFEKHERAQVMLGKTRAKALPSLLDILKAQMAVAGDLAPYLHGKQPIRVVVEDERLPVLVLNLGTNQLDQAKTIEGRRVFSAGAPIGVTMRDINDLENRQDEVTTDGNEHDG